MTVRKTFGGYEKYQSRDKWTASWSRRQIVNEKDHQNMVKQHLNSKCNGTLETCDGLTARRRCPVTWRWSCPCASHKVIEGKQRYSSFLTLALGGGERTVSRAGHFIPEKRAPVFSEQEDVWSPESAWTLKKNENFLLLQGIEPQIFGRGDESTFLAVRTTRAFY